jgi:hypothetical protein
MHLNSKLAGTTLAGLILTLALSSPADEVAQKGREIFEKNQHSVVTVSEVLKMSGSGRSNEQKQDLTGTVVDPSGLTVVALSMADPGELYQRMMGDDYSRHIDTEVADLKILMEDGSEVPAEIVLRDKDLDLAFIRPKSKVATPMAAVDLNKASTAQILDQVITLNRLNSAAGKAYAASVERITAVIQKPRTFYIPDSTQTATSMGSPAFALDGNIVGIFVMRAMSGKGSASRSMRDQMTSIILPAADVLKAAKQAPEAKGDSEKKDAPKDASDAGTNKPAGGTDAK